MKTISFIFLLLISATTAVFSQHKAAQIEEMMTRLSQLNSFSGVVLVADSGKVIFNKAYGWADFPNQKPLTNESVFELASVSKQFTAMGIMMLKEKGSLSYEDKLDKFFPELPYQGITIRNLLNHTSGLPDYMELFAEHWDSTKIAVNKDVISLLAKYKPVISFKPGEKWEYSNTGYVLLASIIEKVSGMSFRDFLQKNIFTPLGMSRSQVYNRRYKPEVISNYAFGYVYNMDRDSFILPDADPGSFFVKTLDGIVGDGCVNSTTGDLFKWDRALYTEQLVKKTTLDEAFTPGKLNNGTAHQYGFGWGVGRDSVNGLIISHSGGWPGYLTWIERMPEKNRTIIILTNNGIFNRGVRDGIRDILNGKKYKLPKPPMDFMLSRAINQYTPDQISPMYYQFKDNFYHDEGGINNLGYTLLNRGETDKAIAVFQLNVEAFPESANVWDSIGEAYQKKNEKQKAIDSYKKSLELDAGNEHAKEMLKALGN